MNAKCIRDALGVEDLQGVVLNAVKEIAVALSRPAALFL